MTPITFPSSTTDQPTSAVDHRNTVNTMDKQQARKVLNRRFRLSGYRSGVMKPRINRVDLLSLRMDERTQSFCTDRFFLQKRNNRVTVRMLIRHGADFA